MDDFVSKFITSMVNSGIVPKSTSQIRPVDRFTRIASQDDRGGKRSISFWLKVEYDFAYGYAKDFKNGMEVRFNSATSDPNITRADMARIKAILKVRKAEEDKRIAERHTKIAVRAMAKWNMAAEEGTTPYLDKKALPLLSGRIYGSRNLFIPIYEPRKDGTLDMVSWQIVEADGTKKFPFGGKKTGCYHIIGSIDPTKPIVICEGWATGASLFMALGRGIVVALDAGNLLPVARAIRSLYATPIIIAADNDESQTGQIAAAKVKKAVVDVSIVMPNKIGHDFNDLLPDEILSHFGLKAESGGGVPDGVDSQSIIPAADASHNPHWQSNLILDGKGRMVATSLQNAILHLIYHQDMENCFAFDEFRQAVLLRRCPPWLDEQDFFVERITDIGVTQCAATLERYGLSCTIDKTAKAIAVAADANKFHSAREYMNELVWDGEERLSTFLSTNLGCKEESPEYLSFVFKKWMTAAVKRVMEPGCKFDHVLILESNKQGLFKSSLLKSLATFNGESYHSDAINIGEIGNKDTVLKLQGNLIIELAELTGFSKQDDEVIKNWITQQIDEARVPFSRETSRFKRQFVFAATTNNHDYLKDPTGNRRYWPVTLENTVNIAFVDAIKDKLWAEAVHWYKSGLYIGPTPEENELAEVERNKRLQSDAWEDTVMAIVERIGLDEFRIPDILSKMDLRTNEKNERTVKRIGKILKMNGYENSPRWDNKLQKSVRLWGKEER